MALPNIGRSILGKFHRSSDLKELCLGGNGEKIAGKTVETYYGQEQILPLHLRNLIPWVKLWSVTLIVKI